MSRPDHADFCNKEHQPGATPCARIVRSGPLTGKLERAVQVLSDTSTFVRTEHAEACNRDHPLESTPCAIVSPPPLTSRDLAALQDGERVKDATGDVWEKRGGWWYCLDSSLRGEQLWIIWGPLTRTEQPAIVTYGEDQG